MVSQFEVSRGDYAKICDKKVMNKTFESRPAVAVSWYDAVLFCRWMTEYAIDKRILESGLEFRLPTESEFMALRGAVNAGSLLDRDSAPGDTMREWCLDYVKYTKQGIPERNEPGVVNLQERVI